MKEARVPTVSKRICNRCKKIVDNNHNCRDKTAEKMYNKINRPYQEFYASPAWKKKKKYIMVLHGGICQECLKFGTVRTANVVDHIVELKDDFSLALVDENLQPLCHGCHNKKTEEERKKRNKTKGKYAISKIN